MKTISEVSRLKNDPVMKALLPIASQRIRTCCAGRSLLAVIGTFLICTRTQALTIIPTFDSSITSDPQASTIEATINSAIAVYEANFSDPVTVSITFHQSTTGLGGNTTYFVTVAYSDYITALQGSLTSADDATALAHLPGGPANPVNGSSSINLKLPLARALGFSADPPPGQPDSTIGINMGICNLSASQTDPTKYSLAAVAWHEMDEALGFGSTLNGLDNGDPTPTGAVYPEDLFRYDGSGTRSFTSSLNATSYFSLDGTTDLARFNQYDGGAGAHADFADWYSPGGQVPQVQDAFGTQGATPVLDVELRVLDAIGYTRTPVPTWVDFNFGGSPQLGTYANPFETMAQGVTAVASGSTIWIKSAGSSPETMTISKAMTIRAYNGAATIGK